MIKWVKRLLILTVSVLVMIGAFAFTERIKMLEIFTLRNVEVFGVINSNKSHINDIANGLVGKNIFDKSIKDLMINNEPWVQKVVARRQLPDKISIYIYEERVLFDYQVTDSCYAYTANDISIKRLCNAPKIFAEKQLSKATARKFYDIVKDEDYFNSSIIFLKDYKYKVFLNNVELVFPYDKDVAKNNYITYKTSLKNRYRLIEYIDMTVVDRIFVKGVLNGSNKG